MNYLLLATMAILGGCASVNTTGAVETGCIRVRL